MTIWQVPGFPSLSHELVVFTCQSLDCGLTTEQLQDGCSLSIGHTDILRHGLVMPGQSDGRCLQIKCQHLKPQSSGRTYDVMCGIREAQTPHALRQGTLEGQFLAFNGRGDEFCGSAAGILRFGLRPFHGTGRSLCICTSAARGFKCITVESMPCKTQAFWQTNKLAKG